MLLNITVPIIYSAILRLHRLLKFCTLGTVILNDSGRMWGKRLWPVFKVLSRHLSTGVDEDHEASNENSSPLEFEAGVVQILVKHLTALYNSTVLSLQTVCQARLYPQSRSP
jgi:hypothetical protein